MPTMPKLETPEEFIDTKIINHNHDDAVTDLTARDAAIRAESAALLKMCGEALEETTRQLENMNQSPAHACSWVKPQSGSTTERIHKNKGVLAALREAGAYNG